MDRIAIARDTAKWLHRLRRFHGQGTAETPWRIRDRWKWHSIGPRCLAAVSATNGKAFTQGGEQRIAITNLRAHHN